MSFGTRLKEKREALGITQPQLAEMLNVSKGAIGNWETDVNSPRATLLYDLFDILHCDANYLFQDETRELYENEASPEEFENIIKKYRELDLHGKKMVDFTLNEEWERSTELAKENAEKGKEKLVSISKYTKEGENENNTVEFSEELIPTKDYLLPNAAHADESLAEITEEMIQAEEDIMNNL